MTLFLVLAAAMTAAALLLLMVPVWRHAADAQRRLFGVLVIAVLLPLGSIGTYLMVSTWQWDAQARAEIAIDSLRRMAADAERDLGAADDVDGWRSLAEFYMGLQDFEGAARAFERAYAMTGGQDVSLAISYAEALALQDPRNLSGEAGSLLDEALARQPDNPRALWYGGLAAYGAGRWSVAEQRWGRLLELDPPAPLARLLTERLSEIRSQSGEAPLPDATEELARPFAAAERPLADAAPAMEGSPGEPGRLSLSVSLATGLETLIRDRAVLYVIVRAAQAGPPLAVRRVAADELPVSLVIDDGDVMLPGQRLADLSGALSITARVSQTGDVSASSGDLYGEGDAVVGEAARIIIDRVVP
ncbi:MAG: hypothetical protein JJU27_02395 [Gammaproteobacteria bacterium]|nr:hypothetical protein [Gammaproteobacteria bacterium]